MADCGLTLLVYCFRIFLGWMTGKGLKNFWSIGWGLTWMTLMSCLLVKEVIKLDCPDGILTAL